jgi:hypothetical protein
MYALLLRRSNQNISFKEVLINSLSDQTKRSPCEQRLAPFSLREKGWG